MADIKSNYPRQNDPSSTSVDLGSITKLSGQLSGVVLGFVATNILITAGQTFGFLDFSPGSIWQTFNRTMTGLGLLSLFYLFKWTREAHRLVCVLRGYQPRIPSLSVGLCCAFSGFGLGIPLWLTFDFLVVHSDRHANPSRTFSGASMPLTAFVLLWVSFILPLVGYFLDKSEANLLNAFAVFGWIAYGASAYIVNKLINLILANFRSFQAVPNTVAG